MKRFLILTVGLTVFAAGCATKRYPVATELSSTEQTALTCRELVIELAKTDHLEVKISDTAETDWRSVAGFLGDYGVGNAMAKNEASNALSERRKSIRSSLNRRGCSLDPAAQERDAHFKSYGLPLGY